jgi:D-alanyl-D-alanine carboxypeptidase
LSGRTSLVTAAVLVLAVAGVAALLEPSPDDAPRLAEQVIDAGAPGVLVQVRDRGKTRTVVLGVAHDAPRRLVHAGDRFRIGSVTKTFVATVVLQLVAEGRIELDDTVDQWLPGLVPHGEEITIRQLLAHMSGLFDYVEDARVFAPYEQNPRHAWSPRALVDLAVAHPSPFRPGERYAYSSTNSLLLELIVERVSATTLERQLDERIIEPLGLESTSFEPGLVPGAHIHGHRPPSHQGIVTGPPRDTSGEAASWTWGAAAIVSTADDLRRFFHALLRGRLLASAQLRDMETLVPAGSLRYGLGLAVFPTPCGDAWGHTGNAQGTITVAWNTRDASRQVIVVVNAFPLTGELEDAVRRLQLSAFCGMDD